MRKLISILLALCLFVACAAAEGEEKLCFGYLAPRAAEGERAADCAEAFADAAERAGVETVRMFYDPAEPEQEEGGAADAPTVAPTDAPAEDASESATAPREPAVLALEALLAEEPDGIVAAPESLEQAVTLAEMAGAAGVPIVIVGVDLGPAYPPTPDPEDEEERPYIANVSYFDGAAAYAAAKWLEDRASSPLMVHIALPGDGDSRLGVQRAVAEASYLELAGEAEAEEDSAAGGREALLRLVNSYTMFYCVLADSEALAEGCAAALRELGESMPVAAIARGPEALELLERGDVDVLASAPASREGEAAFEALWNYVTEGIVPEGESRRIALEAETLH